MLGMAAEQQPVYALLPTDSFALARRPDGRPLIDSVTLAAAVRGPGAEALATRAELGREPADHAARPRRDGGRLRGAPGTTPRRWREVERFRRRDPGAPRAAVRRGAHPLRLGRRRSRRGPASDRARHRGAAGLPALPGNADRGRATSPPPPTSSPTRATSPTPPRRSTWPTRCGARWSSIRPAGRSDPWARAGAGRCWASCTRRVGRAGSSLRQVWQSAAEAGRMAPPDERKHLAHSGATAAIGLFTGPSADSSALGRIPRA